MGAEHDPKRRRSQDASASMERVRTPGGDQDQGRWLLMTTLQRPRVADRPWFEEFDELTEQGFLWHFDRHEWALRRTPNCRCCGVDMELRGFERGDLAYRAYALCLSCGWWIEF